LWKDFSRFVIENIDKQFSLRWKNVLFGFVNGGKKRTITQKQNIPFFVDKILYT